MDQISKGEILALSAYHGFAVSVVFGILFRSNILGLIAGVFSFLIFWRGLMVVNNIIRRINESKKNTMF